MSVVKYAGIITVSVISSFAFSEANIDQVKVAQNQVAEYKALRYECATTHGTKRKACFSELHAATDGYKKAKKVLGNQRLKGGFVVADQGQ